MPKAVDQKELGFSQARLFDSKEPTCESSTTRNKPRHLNAILGKLPMQRLASFVELMTNCESEIEDVKQYLFHMKTDYFHFFD